MNQNAEKLKAIILASPEMFDMKRWGDYVCNTSHCIGGWVDVILQKKGDYDQVADFLSIELFVAHNLCYPKNQLYYHATPEKACQAIDNAVVGYLNPWRGV